MKTFLVAFALLCAGPLLRAEPVCPLLPESYPATVVQDAAKSKSDKSGKPAPQPPAQPSRPEPRREPQPAPPAHLFM